jgi:hypothetical protein
MDKIELQNIPTASFNRTMRDLFQDLIDITMEGNCQGSLKSVPTNYGYVFFWYGWLNKKALQKTYPAYVSKELVKEIRKTKKLAAAHSVQDQIGDFLFSMVREHPEIIGGGHAEVHLAILAPKLKQANVSDAAKALKEFAQKLEKLERFTQKYLKKGGKVVEEIGTSFEVVDFVTKAEVRKFADEYFWDDECGYLELSHRKLGCEIQVRVHFDGDDNLKDLVESIDKVISPIKTEIGQMFRYGKSLWPF